jgi:hypothetical protein
LKRKDNPLDPPNPVNKDYCGLKKFFVLIVQREINSTLQKTEKIDNGASSFNFAS